jgi:hypothetical protein
MLILYYNIKNLIEVFSNKVSCYSCNKYGFFLETPCGADYYTCPCCGNYDFVHSKYNTEIYRKYFLNDDDDDDDKLPHFDSFFLRIL